MMDFDDAKLEQTDQTFMKRLRVQKQPLIDVLQNKRSYKLCNIDRKTPVLECLFNKVARFQHRCFPMNIAKSFCRTPPVTASKSSFYAIGILNPWTFCWFRNESLKVFRSEIGGRKHGINYSRSKLNDLKLKKPHSSVILMVAFCAK